MQQAQNMQNFQTLMQAVTQLNLTKETRETLDSFPATISCNHAYLCVDA